MAKLLGIVAASLLATACSIQTERVIEKPVPAERTVVYTR
jgi:hypothetical protein